MKVLNQNNIDAIDNADSKVLYAQNNDEFQAWLKYCMYNLSDCRFQNFGAIGTGYWPVSELNILAEFMLNRPNVTILIEGHTDIVGSDALNDRLSENRANSVKNYLIQHGIPANKISTKGYGKRKPIASNDTEFGRSLNRRTEIVIQSK